MEVTNADRVVFPADGITKGEVVGYYATVADRMLPYVRRRALTVERYPKGIGGQGFMQKNAPDHYPEDLIRRHVVPREGGGTTVYPVIDSPEAILFYANLGVITFHAPLVTVDDLTHPDWVVWDLDPPEGGLMAVRRAAHLLREVLQSLDIETMPMTSGSKGYHLRAMITPNVDAHSVSQLARGVAALACAAHPDAMTLAFKKADRGDRVFVDWLRNHRYATSVAPWSLRPRDGAPVASPLAWDEVDMVAPSDITIHQAVTRLEGDPWASLETIDLSGAVRLVDEAVTAAGIVLEPFDRFRP